MALDTAKKLGLEKKIDSNDRKVFELADGRLVYSIGKVREYCSFPDDTGIRKRCTFYIWEKCSTPVIIGRPFLEKTKAMETPSRFIQQMTFLNDEASLPIVRLIGISHRRLPCYIDGNLISANPDSGSDLDLMSTRFARISGYNIKRQKSGRYRIRLADGTTAESIGYVEKEITIGDGKKTYLKRFQILPGLQSDVLLRDQTLVEADVFNEQQMIIFQIECRHGPPIADCAPIIHLSSAEKGILDSKRRLKRLLRKPKDNPLSPITLADDQRARDAREIHRRLQEQERMATLTDDERKIAEGLEKIRRENYDRRRQPP